MNLAEGTQVGKDYSEVHISNYFSLILRVLQNERGWSPTPMNG